MKVNEIYRSVQGESSYSGLPCIFVRLTYCHLRCTYCDTEYAFYDGQDYTVNEVLEKIDHFDCSLVEITGGEPLLQKESYSLMDRLVERNYTVLLETSGSLDIQKVNSKVIRIIDLKCPSSGECHRNLYSNLDELNRQDEVKFVVGDRNDYQWARKLLYDYDLTDRCSVLLSTVFGKLSTQQLVKWILEDNLKVRFQLQMHKYIWDPCKKSV
mgnify:CR=1 FL=1